MIPSALTVMEPSVPPPVILASGIVAGAIAGLALAAALIADLKDAALVIEMVPEPIEPLMVMPTPVADRDELVLTNCVWPLPT